MGLGEQIAHLLRVEIITGAIPDGTHLAEDALATRFDVSRGPIRDALRQLGNEGLVESRRKRLYVRALTFESVEELYELRGALEALALKLAIERATEEEWASLQGIVDRMREAGERGDTGMFAEADMDFHTAFYVFSRNHRLLEAWRQYQRTFAVLFEVSDTPDIIAATDDHQGFLDVLSHRDVDASRLRLDQHLASAKAHVRNLLQGQ